VDFGWIKDQKKILRRIRVNPLFRDEVTGRKGESRATTAQRYELRVSWRGCRLGMASTQSRGIPRESGLSGSATRFSPYSVHFCARGSRRRDGNVHGLARSRNRWRNLDWPGLRSDERSLTRSPSSGWDLFPRVNALVRSLKEQEESFRRRNECRGRHQLLAQRGGGLLRSVVLRRIFLGENLARWSEFLLLMNWFVYLL